MKRWVKALRELAQIILVGWALAQLCYVLVCAGFGEPVSVWSCLMSLVAAAWLGALVTAYRGQAARRPQSATTTERWWEPDG
jgi:hypothetical protein